MSRKNSYKVAATSHYMGDLEIAEGIAWDVFHSKSCKFSDHDTYFTNHIKAVVGCLRTPEEKVVGYLHDVVEEKVKEENKRRAGLQLKPLNAIEEDIFIERTLEWIAKEFRKHGHDINRHSPFIRDLDVLTKRTHEKGEEGYRQYGERIIRYAKGPPQRLRVVAVKLADLLNNSDEARNPNAGAQNENDQKRLGNYRALIKRFEEEFGKETIRNLIRDFRKDRFVAKYVDDARKTKRGIRYKRQKHITFG